MNEQLASALHLLPDYLSQHVLLSASAVGLALAICAPLVLAAVSRPRLAATLVAAAGVVQTIPSLALMALFFPILLGLSAVTQMLAGFSVPAFGFLPALLALTLYAMLPILRAGVTGLQQVDADLIEAAKGVGMTQRQSLLRVEIPLAAPILVGGLRTACVWTIGAATLATPIGQTSLGNYVFSGLQTENWIFVITGCLSAAVLALSVDAVLALLEQGLSTRRRRPISISCGLITAIVALAFMPGLRADDAHYVIGAKNFSEQFILAALMRQRIGAEGAPTTLREGLGSAVIYRALRNNDIDAYVDYAGTLWTNVLDRKDRPPRNEMIATLGRELAARDGVRVVGALGFENAYALVMRKDRAASLGIHDMTDLARVAPRLTLGADLEFLQRPEWSSVRETYGLQFRDQKSFNPTFIYQALEVGEVDVISGFSSDGRITADRHLVLADPKGAIPAYDALILLAPKRRDDPLLLRALQPLVGAISPRAMRKANLELDRSDDKLTPDQAAKNLVTSLPAR
jgi:osmoprotectant transport system permease protein